MDVEVGNKGSQRSLRDFGIAAAKGKPHMARWRRQIVTRHYGKVNVGIIPQVDERKTLTTRIMTPFLLIRTTRFAMEGLYAHGLNRWIIGGNLLPFTARRTFTLRQ